MAALVPKPRRHESHYFGAFASHARARAQIVPPARGWGIGVDGSRSAADSYRCALPAPRLVGRGELMPLVKAPSPIGRELSWAELLKRTFAMERLECPCGGRRRIMAFVSDPAKAVEIVEALDLELVEPRLARARGPPRRELSAPPPEGFAADRIYPDG